MHVVVHDGDRQHSGVAHAGESWAVAARRTVASMHDDPFPLDLSGEVKHFAIDRDTKVVLRAMGRGDLPDLLRWRHRRARDEVVGARRTADRGGDRGALRAAHRRDGADPDVGDRGQRAVGRLRAGLRDRRLPRLRRALPGPARPSGSTTRSATPSGPAADSARGRCGRGCCGPGDGSRTPRRTSRHRTTATKPRSGCWPRSASPRGCGSTRRTATRTDDPRRVHPRRADRARVSRQALGLGT